MKKPQFLKEESRRGPPRVRGASACAADAMPERGPQRATTPQDQPWNIPERGENGRTEGHSPTITLVHPLHPRPKRIAQMVDKSYVQPVGWNGLRYPCDCVQGTVFYL